MKQLINKLKHSKILIAATIIVTAILYITIFILSAGKTKEVDSAVVQEPVVEEVQEEIKLTADDIREQSEEVQQDQHQFLDLLTTLDSHDNFSLYCEYQDHTYHVLSKSVSDMQIQYDDILYRVTDTNIQRYDSDNDTWQPLDMDDYTLYEAYLQIQKTTKILSKYMQLIDIDRAYTQQKVTIDGEPFTGVIEYHNKAFRVQLDGYYQKINMIISNIGSTYF